MRAGWIVVGHQANVESTEVEGMLEALGPLIRPRLADPDGKGTTRVLISTPLAESQVAEYLTELAERVEAKGVKVGSYPRWGRRPTR